MFYLKSFRNRENKKGIKKTLLFTEIVKVHESLGNMP